MGHCFNGGLNPRVDLHRKKMDLKKTHVVVSKLIEQGTRLDFLGPHYNVDRDRQTLASIDPKVIQIP